MKPIEDDAEIIKQCQELDKKAEKDGLVVYYLDAARHTFKLGWNAISWSLLAENERYCMVKYGNIFLSKEEAEAACNRIFDTKE